MNDITDKLVDEMPPVQENAIDQLQVEKQSKLDKLRDRMGRAFSSELHKLDENGDPIITKGGQLRVVRGPHKKKVPPVSSIGGLETPGPLGLADGQGDGEAEILVTGQSAASLTFLLGMMVFKEDGKPTQAEINQVTYAYQTYFRAQNIRDLPPGVVLATALITYAGPRMMKPKVQKKISSFWGKLRAKVSKTKAEASEPAEVKVMADEP